MKKIAVFVVFLVFFALIDAKEKKIKVAEEKAFNRDVLEQNLKLAEAEDNKVMVQVIKNKLDAFPSGSWWKSCRNAETATVTQIEGTKKMAREFCADCRQKDGKYKKKCVRIFIDDASMPWSALPLKKNHEGELEMEQ